MRRLTRGLLSPLVGFVIALLALVFFLLLLFILSLEVPECAETITHTTPTTSPTSSVAPPVVTGTIAAPPVPTLTPTLSGKITACADTTSKTLSSLLLLLVNFLAIVVVILLVPPLIWRIWRLSRVSNLVIDTFNNATGNADLDKALSGLNESTRESLVRVIDNIRQSLIKYGDQGPSEYYSPEQSPPPVANIDQSLSNMLTSLKAVPSAGSLQTALQLLSLLFTSRGIKVSITLQKSQISEDIPQVFGISLEVTDLQNRQEPKLFTLWEPSPQPKTVSDDKSSNWLYKLTPLLKTVEPHAAKKQVFDVIKTPEDRIRPLLRPAIRWLAVELLRRSMEAQMPRISRWEIKRFSSRLYNFIGYSYLSSFLTYHNYPALREVAVDYFKRSLEKDKEWFQPYENLADTYVIQVQGVGSTPGRANKELLYQAVSLYNQASSQYGVNTFVMRYLRDLGLSTTQNKLAYKTARYLTCLGLMSTTQSKLAHETTIDYLKDLGLSTTQSKLAYETAKGYLSVGLSTIESRHTYAKVVRRLAISTAIAQLLTGDNDLIREAEDLIKIVTQSWQLDKEKDGQLLYTLARWYGIFQSMFKPVVPDMKFLARRYLIYSLIRKDGYWNLALKDRSFVDVVFTDDEFRTLRTIISKIESEVPALSSMEDRQFEECVNRILVAISLEGWHIFKKGERDGCRGFYLS